MFFYSNVTFDGRGFFLQGERDYIVSRRVLQLTGNKHADKDGNRDGDALPLFRDRRRLDGKVWVRRSIWGFVVLSLIKNKLARVVEASVGLFSRRAVHATCFSSFVWLASRLFRNVNRRIGEGEERHD